VGFASVPRSAVSGEVTRDVVSKLFARNVSPLRDASRQQNRDAFFNLDPSSRAARHNLKLLLQNAMRTIYVAATQ
jgi:hypothetical protein